MNFSKAFTDLVSAIGEVVPWAAGDGFLTMFLVPTCSTEIMGTDLSIPARIFSERHGMETFPMKATENFLGSKFGGTFGMFDVLISRVKGRGRPASWSRAQSTWSEDGSMAPEEGARSLISATNREIVDKNDVCEQTPCRGSIWSRVEKAS